MIYVPPAHMLHFILSELDGTLFLLLTFYFCVCAPSVPAGGNGYGNYGNYGNNSGDGGYGAPMSYYGQYGGQSGYMGMGQPGAYGHGGMVMPYGANGMMGGPGGPGGGPGSDRFNAPGHFGAQQRQFGYGTLSLLQTFRSLPTDWPFG